MKLRSIARSAGWGLAATAIALSSLVAGGTSSAGAQTNPYERGPAPTSSSCDASPRARSPPSQTPSPRSRHRLRRRRDLLPDRHQRGHLRRGRDLARLHRLLVEHQLARPAARLARLRGHRHRDQQPLDQPASRGDQLLAALDYLTQRSSVRTRIDATRLAVAGHSMGGGGSLEAADDRPSLQAAVPARAVEQRQDAGPSIRVPTLIIGGESDTVAPVSSHSIPFYNSIPATLGEGVPGAQRRQPLLPADRQHADRPADGRLAQALRRQRHPLRPVPLPAARLVLAVQTTATPAPAEFAGASSQLTSGLGPLAPASHGAGPPAPAPARPGRGR